MGAGEKDYSSLAVPKMTPQCNHETGCAEESRNDRTQQDSAEEPTSHSLNTHTPAQKVSDTGKLANLTQGMQNKKKKLSPQTQRTSTLSMRLRLPPSLKTQAHNRRMQKLGGTPLAPRCW